MQRISIILKFIIILYLFNYAHGLTEIKDLISNPHIYNNDARQHVVPYFFSNQVINNDYTLNYINQVMLTPGIKAVYSLANGNYQNITFISKVLPYIIYFFTLLFIYKSGKNIYSNNIALLCLVLAILSKDLLSVMLGGHARAFGPFFISIGLFFLIESKIYHLGILTIIACLFYPSAALICGFALFTRSVIGILFLNEKVQKHILLICLVITVCVTTLLPMIQSGSKYGTKINEELVSTYPEAGYGGRNSRTNTPPYDILPKAFLSKNINYLKSHISLIPNFSLIHLISKKSYIILGRILTVLVLLIIFFHAFKKEKFFINLSIFLISALCLYEIAKQLEPLLYFPNRYLSLVVPIILPLTIPVMAMDLYKIAIDKLNYSFSKTSMDLFAIIIVISFTTVLGTKNNGYSHWKGIINESDNKKLYEEILKLPRSSLIAGWPTGIIDNVPYLSRKTAYLTFETHYVFHEKFILEMRRRFNLLLKAYFSKHAEDLYYLRDIEGVTHIIIDKFHYEPSSNVKYFRPFNESIRKIKNENENNYFLSNYLKDDSRYVIIDLNDL